MKANAGSDTLLLTFLCTMLAGCSMGSTFDGSRVENADRFSLAYTLLDRTESADMELEAGDAIQVELFHEKGNAGIVICREGETPVYEGKGLTELDFTVRVAESGTYRISVTGDRARGSASFTRKTAG